MGGNGWIRSLARSKGKLCILLTPPNDRRQLLAYGKFRPEHMTATKLETNSILYMALANKQVPLVVHRLNKLIRAHRARGKLEQRKAELLEMNVHAKYGRINDLRRRFNQAMS